VKLGLQSLADEPSLNDELVYLSSGMRAELE
jgi:hypothetical protein